MVSGASHSKVVSSELVELQNGTEENRIRADEIESQIRLLEARIRLVKTRARWAELGASKKQAAASEGAQHDKANADFTDERN